MRQRLQNYDDEIAEAIYSDWQQVKQLPEPDTIESLLEWNGVSGTHSILDVASVSTEPEFETVSPLSEEQLQENFGTLQPTREQVEEWLENDGISAVRSRWIGLYVIVYKGGKPTEICFAGFSGD